jgi:protein gp37
MSDLFHGDVGADFIAKVFDVMRETPQHTYQVLTK